jgi:predicted nucleic acid-binding protein
VTIVVDASVIVAWLIVGGPPGQWAAEVVTGATHLAAPHHLPVEVANVLRRTSEAGVIGPDTASLAHADLLDLPVVHVPYEVVAERAWALRANLTSYDASYIALAELLDAPLATLDRRMADAPGPRCEFLVPPS